MSHQLLTHGWRLTQTSRPKSKLTNPKRKFPKSRKMSNFAKSQLLKYGWTEGKGLGKNENGIVDALKPKLKFDTTGVGHSLKEHNWWESVYNKALDNISIDASKKSIKLSVKDKDAVEITTSKINLKNLKKAHDLEYGSFLKTCTLSDGKVVASPGAFLGDKVEALSRATLTDDELFAACGGRTAHKGARHGLTLSGKLERIARQEAQWPEVEKMVVKSKKTHKRKKEKNSIELKTEVSENYYNEENNELLLKKQRVKDKRKGDHSLTQIDAVVGVKETDKKEKKRAKKERRKKIKTGTIENKIPEGEILAEVRKEDDLCSKEKLNRRIANRERKRNKIEELRGSRD